MKHSIKVFGYCLFILSVFLMDLGNSLAEGRANEVISFIYIEDHDASLDQESAYHRLKTQQSIAIQDNTFNTGSRESHYWLLFEIKNQTSYESWQRLVTGIPYRVLFQAYLYRQDTKQAELILDENQQTKFSERNNDYRLLNSNAFRLAEGESVDILMRYQTRGATFLPVSTVLEADFQSTQNLDLVFSAWVYSFSLTLGLLFLLLNLAMKNAIGVYYAGLFLLGLLLVASMDGYAFKFLWSDFPLWNQYSSLVLLFSVNAFGFYISHKVSDFENQQLLFNRFALSLTVISIVCMMLVTVIGFSLLVAIANVLLLVMFVFQVLAIRSWMSLRRNKATLSVMVILTLFIAGLVALFFVSDKLPSGFIYYSNYIIYLMISIATMAIITVHMMGLRKDRDVSLKNELSAAKREAKINKELFETEKKYSQVREIARLRQQQLATATHDIKQPLVSLRSTMDSLARSQNSGVRQQLHDAFDYMEQLCNSYLQETHPDNDDSLANVSSTASQEDNPQQAQNDREKPYPVSLIFNTVKRMFETEAEAKNLELRWVDSALMIETPPLIVMRIVSNFLSNAVKHTDNGKVLMGCRRSGNSVRIEVHDTGKGMTKKSLEQLQQAYQKGDESEGEGLGLAISRQLAESHQLTIRVSSTLEKGSCFAVEILLANRN